MQENGEVQVQTEADVQPVAEAQPVVSVVGVNSEVKMEPKKAEKTTPVFGRRSFGKRWQGEKQIAPNMPCPCKSGVKYKKCCGMIIN